MKFLKRLLSKRNNAGFTLLEVVVSVGLMGLLIVSMTVFVTPVLKVAAGNKMDVRATILAETLDSYLNRNIMNSKAVVVFTGVANFAKPAQKTTDLNSIYASNELKELTDNLNTNLSRYGANSYEIRCVGINWSTDERTNDQKYMLTLYKIAKAAEDKLRIVGQNEIFEDCFYDGLFPTVEIEQVTNDEGAVVQALKVNVDVFDNAGMSSIVFRGNGYTKLVNGDFIKTKSIRTPEDDEHADVYIFYVIRKTF